MWVLAVWHEGKQEEECTIPESWICNNHVCWQPGQNAAKAMSEGRVPDDKWLKFPLKKIKCKSESRSECSSYDQTTSVETEDEEHVKRKPKKKAYTDYVTEECHDRDGLGRLNVGRKTVSQTEQQSISEDTDSTLPPPPKKLMLAETGGSKKTVRSLFGDKSRSREQNQAKNRRSRSRSNEIRSRSRSKSRSQSLVRTRSQSRSPSYSPQQASHSRSTSPIPSLKRLSAYKCRSSDARRSRSRSDSIVRSKSQTKTGPSQSRTSSASSLTRRSRSRSISRSRSSAAATSIPSSRDQSLISGYTSTPVPSATRRRRTRSRSKSRRSTQTPSVGSLAQSLEAEKDVYPMPEARFQKRVLFLLVDVRKQLDEVKRNSNRSGPTVPVTEDCDLDQILEPVSTQADFVNLEDLLKNLEKRQKLINKMSLIGGANLRDGIKKMMEKMLSNDLMATMNMKGNKGKVSFETTALYKVIKASATRRFESTEHVIHEEVGRLLKYAPDRKGGGGRGRT